MAELDREKPILKMRGERFIEHYRRGLRIWVLMVILFSVLGQVSVNRKAPSNSLESPIFRISLPAVPFLQFSIGGKIQNLVYAALVIWLLGCIWDREIRPVRSGPGRAVLAFVLVSVIAFVFSPERALGWKSGLRELLMEAGFFFLVVGVLRSPKYQKAALVTLLVGVSLIIGAGLYLYARGVYFPLTPQRIWLSFYHPNSSGSALVLLIPLVVVFIVSRTPGRVRWGAILIGGVLGVALFLTFSRTAWISLLVALAILSLRWKGKFYIWGMIVILIALLIWGVNLGPQSYWKKRVKSLSSWTTDINVYKRLIYWKAALRMVGHRPLVGYGPGYKVFMSLYQKQFQEVETGEIPHGPHNMYLYLAASTGVLGLGAFGWLLIAVFLCLREEGYESRDWFGQNFSRGLTAGLIGFLIGGVADDPLLNIRISFLLWFLFGLVAARSAARMERDRFSKAGKKSE